MLEILCGRQSEDIFQRDDSLPVWNIGWPRLFARRRRQRRESVKACRCELFTSLLLADYNESIKLSKGSTAFVCRGLTWQAKGDYERAIADLDEAIRLDPKNVAAFQKRGLLWWTRTEYDKALEDFDACVKLQKESGSAFMNRGCAWFSKGKQEMAMADFNEAIRLDPKLVDAFGNRGNRALK
jgi:tetratricopeptide (TPR) repeat protein